MNNNRTNQQGYRIAFFITLFVSVLLAGAAGMFWWRMKTAARPSPEAAAEPVSAGSAQSTPNPDSEATAVSPQPEVPVAPIQLSPQRMQSIGVKIGTVASKSVGDELRLYGNVQVNERKTAYVQSRFAGWIRKIYADATGELIHKGQPLFTIYSPDVVATQQEYLLAKSNAVRLQQSSISGVASGAASLVEAAKARLLQWDISPGDLANLEESGKVVTELTVNSPVGGYVTEKIALPNMYVQPETKLYTVADLSEVWVLAQVFQSDSGKIRPGNPAEVTVDAYPGKVFKGRVDYLLPQIDMATRTLPVRMVFENPGLQLRPGMYVDTVIKLPVATQLVIPASAAFRSGTKTLVFVYSGNGNITPREVELGSQVGDGLAVQKGLKAGEQVVTSANFLIDSEAQLQAAAGTFAPPPPGAGAAAAMNTPIQAQANVEITTDPTPPRKGSNTVRVRLTSQDGKAVAGAEVTATFFMPAMPAMGMAAIKTVISAADKGGGMYEGKGDLGSGGTWQVAITARQGGQTIASKQTTLNATGGM